LIGNLREQPVTKLSRARAPGWREDRFMTASARSLFSNDAPGHGRQGAQREAGMHSRRAIVGGAAAVAVATGVPAWAKDLAGSEAATSGPVKGGTHGWPFGGYFGDIGKLGYVEEEYFIAGQASRFKPVGDLGPDGKWTVEPADAGAYRTRLVVRRPRDPKTFNGTVLVEWANVSNGYDIPFADPAGMYEAGFAYVSVSAQRQGVHGFAVDPKGLIAWDPARYGSLSIPDDGLCYDIYTQAARRLRAGRKGRGPDPMGGLKVKKLVAVGGSQSGTRLLSYANAIQPRAQVFDAIMPLVCAGSAAPFDSGRAHPEPADLKPGGNRHSRSVRARIRDDLAAPVMEINSETEALTYVPMRQPDTDRFVYWEIAGATHGPTGQIKLIREKTERDGVGGPGGALHSSDVMWLPSLDAAVRHVHGWINGGKAPPSQPRIAMYGEAPITVRDEHGNAVGGIRLPEVEVPVARYAPLGPRGQIGGQTIPFTPEELRQLYPTREGYVAKVAAAAAAAEQAGVILPARVREYVEAAKATPLGT
jgi:hypothetical protein